DLDAQASTSIVMMGHKRWREAREAKRTNAHLLTHLAGEEKIVIGDYIAKTIGDVQLQGGSAPTLDIIPSAHDLDDREALLMIAHQARFHKISNAEDNVGWLAHRLRETGGMDYYTVPNRVSGQDSRAQGIIAAIAAKYSPL